MNIIIYGIFALSNGFFFSVCTACGDNYMLVLFFGTLAFGALLLAPFSRQTRYDFGDPPWSYIYLLIAEILSIGTVLYLVHIWLNHHDDFWQDTWSVVEVQTPILLGLIYLQGNLIVAIDVQRDVPFSGLNRNRWAAHTEFYFSIYSALRGVFTRNMN